MNTTTANVLKMQTIEKTSMEWESLFQEVYADMVDLISTLTQSYEYQLNGDIAAAESEAGLLLMHTIDRFDDQGYEFRSFYSRSLHNKLRDMVRTAKAKKNSHAYGTVGNEIDFIQHPGMMMVEKNINEEIDHLYGQYVRENPGHGHVLDLMLQYSAEGYSKSDLTAALIAYYGETTYTGTIQKRVSRIRESFRNYLADHGRKI